MFRPKMKRLFTRLNIYNRYFLALFIFSILVILAASNYANHQNLRRDQLTRNIQDAADELKLLSASVGQMQTTQRLEEESKRLNLVKAQPQDISYLDASGQTVALRD